MKKKPKQSDGQYRKKGRTTLASLQKMPPRSKVSLGGTPLTLYSLSWLAAMFNVHPMHLRTLERKGVLPPPLLRKDKQSYRMYMASEILGYAKVYHAWRKTGGKYAALSKSFWQFRGNLRELIERDKDRLFDELPNETEVWQIMQRVRSQRRDEWKHKIDDLIK